MPFLIRRGRQGNDRHGQARAIRWASSPSASRRQNTTKLLSNRKTWLVFNRHAVDSRLGGRSGEAGVSATATRSCRSTTRRSTTTRQINAELARKADRKIMVTVERAAKDAEGKPTGESTHHDRRRAAADARLGPGDEDGPDHGGPGRFARRSGRNPARRPPDRAGRRSDDAARPSCPPGRQDDRTETRSAKRARSRSSVPCKLREPTEIDAVGVSQQPGRQCRRSASPIACSTRSSA